MTTRSTFSAAPEAADVLPMRPISAMADTA